MHGSGKSDPPIVPGKWPNKPGPPGAEAVEGRGGAEGTAGRQSTGRTQSRETVSQALACVREAAKRNRNERFTSLMHHVTPELLAWAFHQLKATAAPGVDGVTWEEYAGLLDANIDDLHRRVMRGGYRAKPSRRQYIPKADGRQRPLGIAALEDKIVQRARVEVLNAIYETDFLGFSYGFRPRRSQHDALDALAYGINRREMNWVLDADIRAFFDCISHERMMRFPEHRIGDRRVLRLAAKRLKAGVMEGVDGKHRGDATGRGHLAALGEHLPALRPRPLGGPVAQAQGERRSHRHPLRRRHHRRLQAACRCRAVPPRSAGAAGEVRPGAASRRAMAKFG